MSQANNNNGDDDKKYKKVFVGGLAWRITTDGLRNFFQERGDEVLDANVVSETLPDGNLKSKGYGFVTFRDVESANRACEHPPIIEGRQTNINLAYQRAKNNLNHSNQTGLLQQAGPSHQYQHGLFQQAGPSHQYQHGPFNPMAWHQYQKGWSNQMSWYQRPQFHTNQHFPQAYWGAPYGAYYSQTYDFSHYHYSSTMNCYQTSIVRSAGISQPPREPRLKELNDVDQQKGKDQGEISGEDNGIKQDVKDQEGEINGQDNGIKQDVKDQEGEINGQDYLIKQDVKDEHEKIVSGENENTNACVINQFCEEKSENKPQENGLDHEEKTQHMEAGLITKETDKNTHE